MNGKKGRKRSTDKELAPVNFDRLQAICETRNTTIYRLHKDLLEDKKHGYSNRATFYVCIKRNGKINAEVLEMIAKELNCCPECLSGSDLQHYTEFFNDHDMSVTEAAEYLSGTGYFIDADGYIFRGYGVPDRLTERKEMIQAFHDFMVKAVPFLHSVDSEGNIISFADYLEDLKHIEQANNLNPNDSAFMMNNYDFVHEFRIFEKRMMEVMQITHGKAQIIDTAVAKALQKNAG